MWFDSHCHLHICEEERPVADVIAEARAAGVERMVTVGIDPGSNDRSFELAATEGVWAAVGIHPNSSSGWDGSAMARVKALASDQRVVAIGESGLDFYRDYAPREDQEAAFEAHIALSKELEKSLIIHTRDSIEETLGVLERVGPPQRVIFHCWSGGPVDLRRALDLGAYISFAGNVSFSNAQDLRDVAALVERDRLLVETDSPYLSPVPFRGKPNSPARVVHVGAAVADVLGISSEDLAERTTQNAVEVFQLS